MFVCIDWMIDNVGGFYFVGYDEIVEWVDVVWDDLCWGWVENGCDVCLFCD